MGTVVQFRRYWGELFTPEMRNSLVRLAAGTPGAQPVVFGKDGDGSEFCCLGNGLMVGWDRRRRLVLTDTLSGYVDHGPFESLEEICLLVTRLTV